MWLTRKGARLLTEKSALTGNERWAMVMMVALSFFAGMAFLILVGVGVTDTPAPVPVLMCVDAEVQSPRDLRTNATGLRPAKAVTLTDAQAHKLPQTNIHFHLGSEHRSDNYDDGTDMAVYDEGLGDAEPVAPPASLGLTHSLGHPVRPGWMCPSSPYTTAQRQDTYEWQCCQGEMHVDKSYEVHYVHSTAAPGTDFDPKLSDGLGTAAQGRGLQNPMIVVEAMVFHIVNDDSPQYTYDDLVHGWDLPGLQSTDRVMYPGSTTGNSFNNTVCSPYAVTWHVDRVCHPVSAASFDQMCCMMHDTYGMLADLHPHPSRLLVDPAWVATPEEVVPLA